MECEVLKTMSTVTEQLARNMLVQVFLLASVQGLPASEAPSATGEPVDATIDATIGRYGSLQIENQELGRQLEWPICTILSPICTFKYLPKTALS